MSDRKPQRFKFRYSVDGCWHFGACFPIAEENGDVWMISTCVTDEDHDRVAEGGSFSEDPWEVMGYAIGDAESFAWIDNEYDWQGDNEASVESQRIADAAPDLLEACKYVSDRLERVRLIGAQERSILRFAIDKAEHGIA